jgi:NADPH2:quinone reductase
MKTPLITFDRPGGPEVLHLSEIELATPTANQVRLEQRAIGLNYIDIYQRQGVYPVPSLPSPLGIAAVGVVAARGRDAAGLAVGQRVAYVGALGAYAGARLISAERLVPVPDDADDAQAASLFQALTAHFLLQRAYVARAGDTIVVHAAAGGVGLILCQWARALGVTVIGLVSTPSKAELARAHGCAHVLLSGEDWVAAIRRLTDGRGAAAVYDSVGRDTFLRSLDCLRVGGTLVLYGQSSGPAPPIDPDLLRQKGSLSLTFPSSAHLLWPLAEAAVAQRAVEQRQTQGSTLLIP